jgi:phosphatidate cytidylyltransferase
LRVISGAAMAMAALAALWSGGWPFALFWTVAAVAVLHEWLAMVSSESPRGAFAAGSLAVAAAAALAQSGHSGVALLVLAAGAALVLFLVRDGREPLLSAGGVLYSGAVVLPAILLREGPSGAAAVLYIFAVVWGTDIMAYFTGRTLGGPKLWPRVSPKKTWSGFVGGVLCGALAGLGVVSVVGGYRLWPLLILGIGLAVVSQGGDLFESSLKRRFGTKDASRLIPGHGGVMDRLDGFIAAALVAALVAALRNPLNPADGLLVWQASTFTIP